MDAHRSFAGVDMGFSDAGPLLASLERRREALRLDRERLEAAAARRLQARLAARQQHVTNLRKRAVACAKSHGASKERNSKLLADVQALVRVVEDTCTVRSQAAAALRQEQRRYLQFVNGCKRKGAQESKSRDMARRMELEEQLQAVARQRDTSFTGSVEDWRRSVLDAPSLDTSAHTRQTMSPPRKQPETAASLAREKEALRQEMKAQMASAERDAAQRAPAADARSGKDSAQLSPRGLKDPPYASSTADSTREDVGGGRGGSPTSLGQRQQDAHREELERRESELAAEKDRMEKAKREFEEQKRRQQQELEEARRRREAEEEQEERRRAEEEALRVQREREKLDQEAKERARQQQQQQQQQPAEAPKAESGGTSASAKEGGGGGATSAGTLSEDEQYEASLSALLSTAKMRYKTIRHLAQQLEAAMKLSPADVSPDAYSLAANPCALGDLASVVEVVVSNKNAVAEHGIELCASAFSELVRRYPGGVFPKAFIQQFLWEAPASAYKEAELHPFLSEETQDVWKAVKKHMGHIKQYIPYTNYADAMSQVLLGSTKPTAATKTKLKAFVEACVVPPGSVQKAAPAGGAISKWAPSGARAGQAQESDSDGDEGRPAPEVKNMLVNEKKPPVLLGGTKRPASSSGSANSGGSSYKLTMSAIMKSTNLLKDLDSDEEDEEEGPAMLALKQQKMAPKADTRPKTAPAGGGVPTGSLNTLLKGKQWATKTPVLDGEDEFDF